MTLGKREKILLLIVIPLAAYRLLFMGPTVPASPQSTRTPVATPAPKQVEMAPTVQRTASVRKDTGTQEWLPSLKPKKDQPDLTTIDPTLRLDLIERLAKVTLSGGNRSLFEFGAPPPPPAPIIKLSNAAPAAPPQPPVVAPSQPVGPPPAPPIPLKFYGFVDSSGTKKAFFMSGDEILLGTVGQVLKTRYKIVRITGSTAVLEDAQYQNNQQILPLEKPPA